MKSHPVAVPLMEEFADQQQKRTLWPRASQLIMLTHTGPNFTKQLLKKALPIGSYRNHMELEDAMQI